MSTPAVQQPLLGRPAAVKSCEHVRFVDVVQVYYTSTDAEVPCQERGKLVWCAPVWKRAPHISPGQWLSFWLFLQFCTMASNLVNLSCHLPRWTSEPHWKEESLRAKLFLACPPAWWCNGVLYKVVVFYKRPTLTGWSRRVCITENFVSFCFLFF